MPFPFFQSKNIDSAKSEKMKFRCECVSAQHLVELAKKIEIFVNGLVENIKPTIKIQFIESNKMYNAYLAFITFNYPV